MSEKLYCLLSLACLAIFAQTPEAALGLPAEKLKTAESHIQFPKGASLGALCLEEVTTDSPYLRTVKPPFSKASGQVSFPSGSKLHVQVSYAVLEDPQLLNYFNQEAIVSLQLKSLPIDDAFVARLKGFKYLRKLALDDTDITDGCFQYLSSLPALEELNVSQTNISGRGFEHLSSLKKLIVLHANHTTLASENLSYLGAVTSLRILDLSHNKVSDQGLTCLAPLSNLLELAIAHTQVSDAGLAKLTTLKKLRFLDVAHTNVSAAGLLALRGCNLKNIDAINIKISPRDELLLRKAFPDVYLKRGKQEFKVDPEMFRPLH